MHHRIGFKDHSWLLQQSGVVKVKRVQSVKMAPARVEHEPPM